MKFCPKFVPAKIVFIAMIFSFGAIDAFVEYNRVLYSSEIAVPGINLGESESSIGEIDSNATSVPGEAIVSVIRDILEDMSHDWLPNDLPVWPTGVLDNPQSYQMGQLSAAKQILLIFFQRVSRMNPTDPENPHLARAVSAIQIDPTSWMMPAFEDELDHAVRELDVFLGQIRSGQVKIPDRKDTFAELLKVFGTLLGSSVGQLGGAPRVGNFTITTMTAGDTHAQGEKVLSRKDMQTPWLQIDNVFYYNQGVMFVVKHVLAATLVDFRGLIRAQNSTELGRSIVLIMDPYYYETSPPVVLNGMPLGLLPNHSIALHAVLLNAWFDITNLSLAVSGR